MTPPWGTPLEPEALRIRIGSQSRSHAQDKIKPETQEDHANDQQVLDKHQYGPKVAEIANPQVIGIHQHEVNACDDKDQQGGIHPNPATLRYLAEGCTVSAF